MKFRRITSAVAILALMGAVAGCSDDDDGAPAPTATSRPATSTVPPQNTATRTATSALPPATQTATGTSIPTATGEVPATVTPTAEEVATLTPTGTEGPTDVPTEVPTPTATPEVGEPTPTATTGAAGLGLREFTVVRLPVFELGDPTSSFNSSAIGGFDVSQDPWLPSTFKLLAGEPGENGVASLGLVEDVIVGFPVLDTSIACFKFLAAGSTGEVACQAGQGRAVKLSQKSNGAGPPDPPVLTSTIDPGSVAGSVYLALDGGFANLPAGSSPGECATAAFMGIGPNLISSWSAEAEVIDSRPSGDTISLTGEGRPFDCGDWTNPTGPGMIINPVIGFDQPGLGGGDVGNLLVVYGEGTTP